jgi:hypothetical protein
VTGRRGRRRATHEQFDAIKEAVVGAMDSTNQALLQYNRGDLHETSTACLFDTILRQAMGKIKAAIGAVDPTLPF